jgi:serine/threonine protein kinase/Tfp pilus assembly protein PilF
VDSFDEQMLGIESINYCINPKCRQRQNPAGSETCFACETPLLINNRYRAVRMLYRSERNQRERNEIFELQDFGVGEAGSEVPKILKVLTDDRDSDLVRLFQQEELILRQLKHLAVPQVFPGGYFTCETSCGKRLHCLAMEKIEGKNLKDWLEENGIISENQAIIWLKELTKILDAVHSKDWFHRDIKPSNIMCRPDGNLVLIDFGTATEIMSGTYIHKYENCDVTLVCSTGYTPPEQMNCAAIPKSDLFALGRTFVHLITGQRPDCLPTTTKAELIWRKLAPQISAPLADLIDEMMANDSQHRTQNTSAVLQRLAEIEALDLVVQKFKYKAAIKTIIISRYIGLKLLKSRWLQLGLGASLFLGSMGFKLVAPQLAVRFNNCAVDRYQEGRLEEAQLCVKLALTLDSKLEESYYIQGLIFDAKRDFMAARDRYEKSMTNVADKSLNNLARLDLLEKQYAAAIPRLEKGLQLVKEVDLKSALHKNMGWALLEKGDYQQAENHLNEAIVLDRTRASAYCLLARVREAQKDSSGAVTAWQSCLKYAPNDKNRPELANWVIQARQRLEFPANQGLQQQ